MSSKGDATDLANRLEGLSNSFAEARKIFEATQYDNCQLREKLHAEKMRNAAVETVMLVVILLLGMFAVFK